MEATTTTTTTAHGREREEEEDKEGHRRQRHESSRREKRRYESSDSEDSETRRRRRRRKKREKEQRRAERREKESESASASAADAAKRVVKRLRDDTSSQLDLRGYNDEENPFNDPSLSSRFVWGKKIEKKMRETGANEESVLTSYRGEEDRQRRRLEEIDAARERREKREAEKIAQEEELELLARERSLAEARGWEVKEEHFHRRNAMRKSAKRLRSGRPEAIDMLAVNVSGFAGLEHVDVRDPLRVFTSQSVRNLTRLMEDISMQVSYAELAARHGEGEPDRDEKEEDVRIDVGLSPEEVVEYWKASELVCQKELALAHKKKAIDDEKRSTNAHRASRHGRGGTGNGDSDDDDRRGRTETGTRRGEEALDDEASVELQKMVHGLTTLPQVDALLEGVESQISSNEGDVEYWVAVLAKLRVHRAGMAMRDFNERARQVRLKDSALLNHGDGDERNNEGGYNDDEMMKGKDGERMLREKESLAMSEEAAALVVFCEAWMEPQAVSVSKEAYDAAVDTEEDSLALRQMRARIKEEIAQKTSAISAAVDLAPPQKTNAASGTSREPSSSERANTYARSDARATTATETPEENAFRRQALRVMDNATGSGTNVPFGGEVKVRTNNAWWGDKYEPRKPRFFNRVHTSYDWNKYNQTHYDYDNPPPKVVSGYKFNIFYPDLIDKSKAPTYRIEPDPSSVTGETCLIRFSAGPPYEDIAFKIVNKEFEHSHKRGFKCTFDRGILHLYFNFVRPRYRR